MNLKKLLLFLTSFCYSLSWSQQFFPGGVAGAETWYIVDYANLAQGQFPNLADPYIRLSSCTSSLGSEGLFNFNHSINTNLLCLTYNASLENTTSRNVFFVGEPKELNINYGHLTTNWRTDMSSIILPAWINRYRFDLANKGAYANNNSVAFNSVTKANINFYNWNVYQSDKRFKSYGLGGETAFNIGKSFTNTTVTPTLEGQSFMGNFPEFISYPFELTANQKNRVESYLALKYGITLAPNTPYRNAKNTVFWNAANYTKFGTRIFGIGRDNISGLNQLQSESVHNRNYLIASVRKLMDTNLEKQQIEQIANNNFIVFGDNGLADGLMAENEQHVRILHRKWLSQNTNEKAKDINIYFKFNLMTAINQAMTANSTLKLWMLHDKYTTNQTVSDFTSQYVEYYDAAGMDGLQYGFFEDVFFDTDDGFYDQFTFGVGPDMIVQLRFDNSCDTNRVRSTVVITGGRPSYKVNITSTNGYNENFVTNENTLNFEALAPSTYTVTVEDSVGNVAETEVEVVVPQINVNLGPDIVFNASQQQATLNAGQNVLDPTATYKWYKDGVLLDFYGPVLTVTEPGEYTVEVTSGNMMCQKRDTIIVGYNFAGSAYVSIGCEDDFGNITATVTGGVPPFTTVASGNTVTVSQVHSTTSGTITNLPPDVYTVTTTDSSGNVFQTSLEILDMLEGMDVDLEAQIPEFPICFPSTFYSNTSVPAYTCGGVIALDASVLVTNPNVIYEWYVNGNYQSNINGPLVELYNTPQQPSPDPSGFNEFQVLIYNLETGCYITETVAINRMYGIRDGGNNQPIGTRIANPQPAEAISAKVYPNPSDVNATFYYEITSSEVFSGTVYIYSPNGALLFEKGISGQSEYNIPLSLTTSGTYLAITKVGEKTLTNKIIIK
ncbi:hypothetical protein AM493_17155 [Flavobacterium akiainvivens]|uniref:DUF8202 domain-containing protein n=1 Tax=Flavobacterium akiainvivens TaxID=1202724 RepID=A0A0M9VJB5_9FLAO|nr:T9SS type A sorting domain-containing protein [Flavobacterium akiainvivens]KOS07576.1 hypothetical protein AM493_17155 [Flavobacterium akiainvivens]SFQ21997.1 Por secretion system C-terminal sorting domain-containing protein [Flavobacterium akiainvivens]